MEVIKTKNNSGKCEIDIIAINFKYTCTNIYALKCNESIFLHLKYVYMHIELKRTLFLNKL